MTFRLCLNQVNFPGISTADFLAVAAASGFDAVELHPFVRGEGMADVVAAVDAADLEVVSVNPLPDWFTSDPGSIAESARRLIEIGSAVAAGFVGAPAPLFDPTHHQPPPVESMALAFGALTACARERGIGVAFEPVGRSIMRRGYCGAIGTLDSGRALCAAAGVPSSLVLDTFAVATAGDPCRLDDVSDLALVQLAAYDSVSHDRVFPSPDDPVNRGVLNALVATGYDGPIALEVFPLTSGNGPEALASDMYRRLISLVS